MTLASFVDRTVTRLRRTPVDLARLPPDAVPGSMFSGAAGVAFFLYEAARLRAEDDLFDRARRWSRLARSWAERATNPGWLRSPYGFVSGASGLAFVEALLAAHEEDSAGVLRAVERIDRASASFAGLDADLRPTELFGGSAGFVSAALNLDERLGGSARLGTREVLYRVRQRATAALEDAYGAGGERATPDRLGMAHGFAGELWALMAVLGPAHELVRTRLDELASLRETDANGRIYWLPTRTGRNPSMLGSWCGGMPGQSLLWSEVARRTRSKRALRMARQVAESVAILITRNASLCCGLTGQSVALQRYADVSGDARFARRAYDRIARAARAAGDAASHERSLGLWQGPLGVALVAMSRLAGERSFPCIEAPSREVGPLGRR